MQPGGPVVAAALQVFGWGYNGNGQLGLGNNVNQTSPRRVTNLQGVVIQKVSAGPGPNLCTLPFPLVLVKIGMAAKFPF